MRKRLCIAGVMIVLAALAQAAWAALPYYLPDSTYGEDNGWQGYKNYEEEGLFVMLTFNVYDMQANPGEVEWLGDIGFPEADRYLYAYQLFNRGDSTEDVTALNLVDLSGNPIAQFLMHLTQAVADPAHADAVMPDPNPSEEQGRWTWSPGVGYISATQYSTFLIFSSDKAPIAGDFRVETIKESDVPVPEPATMALLGGAVALIASRRNKRNRPA